MVGIKIWKDRTGRGARGSREIRGGAATGKSLGWEKGSWDLVTDLPKTVCGRKLFHCAGVHAALYKMKGLGLVEGPL
jgi:hypothetical protein